MYYFNISVTSIKYLMYADAHIHVGSEMNANI